MNNNTMTIVSTIRENCEHDINQELLLMNAQAKVLMMIAVVVAAANPFASIQAQTQAETRPLSQLSPDQAAALKPLIGVWTAEKLGVTQTSAAKLTIREDATYQMEMTLDTKEVIVVEGRLRLNDRVQPKTIDLIDNQGYAQANPQEKSPLDNRQGLYAVEGDTLTIVADARRPTSLDPPTEPSRPRPITFRRLPRNANPNPPPGED